MLAKRILLAAGIIIAAPASAYTLIGADWTWMRSPLSTPIYINVNGFPGGTAQQVTNALRDGLQIWENEGNADFAFTYGGTTNNTSFSADGTFISQYSNTTAGGGTLAVTQSWSNGWGDMTECDQRYYARNAYGAVNWSADPAGASWSEIDLQYVAMHEFGHCAGLDHSSNRNAVMYASTGGGIGPANRHLHSDDVAGLQAMYGVAAGGGDLVLEINGAVIANQSHTYTISGADPGERVYLLFSANGVGNGPCPAALGGGAICLGIRGPFSVLASANANNNGEANITATLPTQYAGWTIGFQAGALRGVNGRDSVLSNAEGVLALPAGTTCPAGTSPDCAGNCFDASWVGDGGCDDGTMYRWGNPDFNCGAYAYDAGDCGP